MPVQSRDLSILILHSHLQDRPQGYTPTRTLNNKEELAGADVKRKTFTLHSEKGVTDEIFCYFCFILGEKGGNPPLCLYMGRQIFLVFDDAIVTIFFYYFTWSTVLSRTRSWITDIISFS